MLSPISKHRNFMKMMHSDFKLCTAGGSIKVHKALLAMHSEVFLTMLTGEWKETEESCITLDGVTLQTLQHLKQYIYLGTLPEDGLEQLLLIAARYMMDNLKTECIAKLIATVTADNLSHLIEFACENNVPDLIKAIILQTPDSIVNSLNQLKIDEIKPKEE